jgi:hypothetical protein
MTTTVALEPGPLFVVLLLPDGRPWLLPEPRRPLPLETESRCEETASSPPWFSLPELLPELLPPLCPLPLPLPLLPSSRPLVPLPPRRSSDPGPRPEGGCSLRTSVPLFFASTPPAASDTTRTVASIPATRDADGYRMGTLPLDNLENYHMFGARLSALNQET